MGLFFFLFFLSCATTSIFFELPTPAPYFQVSYSSRSLRLLCFTVSIKSSVSWSKTTTLSTANTSDRTVFVYTNHHGLVTKMQSILVIIIGFLYFQPLDAFVNSIIITKFQTKFCYCTFLTNASFLFRIVADVDCGISKFRNGRIVNGIDAMEGEFPWWIIFSLWCSMTLWFIEQRKNDFDLGCGL